jgi:hypothetical protein
MVYANVKITSDSTPTGSYNVLAKYKRQTKLLRAMYVYCVINGNGNCRNYTTENTQKTPSPWTSVIDKLLIVELVKKFFRFIITTFARAMLWTPLILNSILPTTS